jgi:hypothetical protein
MCAACRACVGALAVALQLYGGCADGTLQGVLQAQPDAGSALGGGESPKVGRADFYRGSQDSFDSELLSPVSRESSMSGNHQWWNPEKWRWMPESVDSPARSRAAERGILAALLTPVGVAEMVVVRACDGRVFRNV